MQNRTTIYIFAVFIVTAVMYGCNGKTKSIEDMALKARRDALIEKYPKIPHDEIFQEDRGARLYSELQGLYKQHLAALKYATIADSVKLIVVVISGRIGKNSPPENQYGIPFILNSCDELIIENYDFSPKFLEKGLEQITQISEESIWSKEGSVYIAGLFGEIINKYGNYRSSPGLSKFPKPQTFGDVEPEFNEVLNEGKTLAYKLKISKQGLRMDHELKFPKQKQTVLFLGDAKVFSPYLDNEYIFTAQLQRMFPDREIINAGTDNYNMDDFESFYREKGRYAEPDIVIVCTDGSDILEEYFSQRNQYSRSKRIYPPAKIEADFYFSLFGHKNKQ